MPLQLFLLLVQSTQPLSSLSFQVETDYLPFGVISNVMAEVVSNWKDIKDKDTSNIIAVNKPLAG